MGWLSRLELPTSRATIWRSNQLNYSHHMEQVMGIEPTPTAWQAVVLAVILHLHGIPIADAGSVRLNLLFFRMVYEPTMESGAE